jgi:hypothetical protein
MSHYDDSQGGRDYSLHAEDFAPDVTDLIQQERFEEAAVMLVEGDEISGSILGNDAAETLKAYLPTSFDLERIGLCWMVVTQEPAQAERAVA